MLCAMTFYFFFFFYFCCRKLFWSVFILNKCIWWIKEFHAYLFIIKILNFNNDIILDQGFGWWWWSYGSWIYSYLCNQCLSPWMLWVPILLMVGEVYSIHQVCQWLVALQVLRCPPPIKLTTWYNWNIVESGVKHHNPNPYWVKLEPHVHTHRQRGGDSEGLYEPPLETQGFLK